MNCVLTGIAAHCSLKYFFHSGIETFLYLLNLPISGSTVSMKRVQIASTVSMKKSSGWINYFTGCSIFLLLLAED